MSSLSLYDLRVPSPGWPRVRLGPLFQNPHKALYMFSKAMLDVASLLNSPMFCVSPLWVACPAQRQGICGHMHACMHRPAPDVRMRCQRQTQLPLGPCSSCSSLQVHLCVSRSRPHPSPSASLGGCTSVSDSGDLRYAYGSRHLPRQSTAGPLLTWRAWPVPAS